MSIAAEHHGRTIAAAITIPARAETYTAAHDAGAFQHTPDGTRPLRCNPTKPLAQTLVATGFAYTAEKRASQARLLTAVLPSVRDIRRGGSCCVDLCSLAAGRVDTFYEHGLKPWDYTAGGLIIEQAGGRAEGLHRAPASPRLVIAGSPGNFQALHNLLADIDTDLHQPERPYATTTA